LNLYDFWNIAVWQGNAATSVRYGGLYNTHYVENFVMSVWVSNCVTAHQHKIGYVMSLPVKESWKSINYLRSYQHE